MLTEERSKETFEPWHIRVRVQLVLTLKSHSFFREQEAQYLYINSMKELAWCLSHFICASYSLCVWSSNPSLKNCRLRSLKNSSSILILEKLPLQPWNMILDSKSLKTQERSFESRLSTSFEAISLRSCGRQRIPQTLTLLGHKEVDTIFLEFLLEWIDKRTLSQDKQLSDHLSRKEYYHWIGYMWQQINLSIKFKTTVLYNFPGGCSLLTLYTQT